MLQRDLGSSLASNYNFEVHLVFNLVSSKVELSLKVAPHWEHVNDFIAYTTD